MGKKNPVKDVGSTLPFPTWEGDFGDVLKPAILPESPRAARATGEGELRSSLHAMDRQRLKSDELQSRIFFLSR